MPRITRNKPKTETVSTSRLKPCYIQSRGVYQITINTGRDQLTGKLKRTTVTGKTEAEVMEKAARKYIDVSDGRYSPSSDDITFGELLDMWLYNFKSFNLSPTTYNNYLGYINYRIKPALGATKLKSLTTDQIQRFYVDVRNHIGLSAATIRRYHSIFNQALDYAVSTNKIPYNPSKSVTLPKREQKVIRWFTRDEQSVFQEAIKDEYFYTEFMVALFTGMRRGEVLALTWDKVDLVNNTIKVDRTIISAKPISSNPENAKRELIFKEPKSKKGIRIIPVPENIIPLIREHRLKQTEEKLKVGRKYKDQNLVFCTDVGTPIDPNNLGRAFRRIVKQQKIDVSLHSMRHTYATRLLEEKEHPKVVQELLGHSDVGTTLNIYSHVEPEIKVAAANKLNSLVKLPAAKKEAE